MNTPSPDRDVPSELSELHEGIAEIDGSNFHEILMGLLNGKWNVQLLDVTLGANGQERNPVLVLWRHDVPQDYQVPCRITAADNLPYGILVKGETRAFVVVGHEHTPEKVALAFELERLMNPDGAVEIWSSPDKLPEPETEEVAGPPQNSEPTQPEGSDPPKSALAPRGSRKRRDPETGCTKRELEAVKRSLTGMPDVLIARDMGVSESTLRTERLNGMRTLGVNDRGALLVVGCADGWHPVEHEVDKRLYQLTDQQRVLAKLTYLKPCEIFAHELTDDRRGAVNAALAEIRQLLEVDATWKIFLKVLKAGWVTQEELAEMAADVRARRLTDE